MNIEQVKQLLDKMGKWIPDYKIEDFLGMPKNTLQKVLNEKEKKKRELPKKWVIPLTDCVEKKRFITMGISKKEVTEPIVEIKEQIKETKKEESTEKGLTAFQLYQRTKLGLK